MTVHVAIDHLDERRILFVFPRSFATVVKTGAACAAQCSASPASRAVPSAMISSVVRAIISWLSVR